MQDIDYFKGLLQKVLTDHAHRPATIKLFQAGVWDCPREGSSPEMDILRDLAYDLDFYEPNEAVRGEDASYYGDERLVQEITAALQKIRPTDNDSSSTA